MLYSAERLILTLIRGQLFFRLGRFVRSNGSLSAVIAISFFVTSTNLFAKYDTDSAVGYWARQANQAKITSSNQAGGDSFLGLDEIDGATAQLALGADAQTRRDSTILGSRAVNNDDLVIDSSDLFAYGVNTQDGELTDEVEIYTIQEGDTLGSVAETKGVSVNTLLWANDIADSNEISPGDTIFILPITGVKHKVRNTDTLDSISQKYKADKAEILAFNGLPANGELKSGQEIIIPDGEIAPPPPKPKPIIAKREYESSFAPITGSSSASKGSYAHPLPGSVKTQGLHPTNAVDLAAPMGTKVYAAKKGKVTKVLGSGWGGGYGKHIVITHSDGTITLYAHLSSIGVNKGDSVKKGEAIGRVGSTGRSTGPHLHFEIRGGPRNPF